LSEAARQLERPELLDTARDLVSHFMQEFYRDGFFFTEPGQCESYLHGHCYAVEGLVYAVESGLHPDDGLLMKVGDQLAKAQLDNGGLQTWWGRSEAPQEVADTTAQAVRIWQCIDPKAFSFEIRRGLAFLKSQAHPKGGIRYQPDSDHLNTWATVFTAQALLFKKREPDWQWII